MRWETAFQVLGQIGVTTVSVVMMARSRVRKSHVARPRARPTTTAKRDTGAVSYAMNPAEQVSVFHMSEKENPAVDLW